MTSKTRNRYFIVSLISVFVMAVTILFGGGKISLSPLLVRGSSSEPVFGSITWNKNSAHTNTDYQNYNFYEKTGKGTGIYLYSYSRWEPLSFSNNIFDSSSSNSDFGIYITSEAGNKNSLFDFQRITAVTLVTGSNTYTDSSNGFKVYVNGLSEDPYIKTNIAASTSYRITTQVANGTSLVIKPILVSDVLSFTSITIEYTCFAGGLPTEKTLSSISISDQATEFSVGDPFVFGGVVTANYNDATTSVVTGSAVIDSSGVDMSSEGEYTVNVYYTESGVTKSDSYTIVVSESEDGSVVLSGTYNYSGRVLTVNNTTVRDWTGEMKIIFNADGTCIWRNDRPSSVTSYRCRVNFNYEATSNGSNIEIHLYETGYYFERKGKYDADYSEWDNTGCWNYGYADYDRPVDAGYAVVNNPKNETGLMGSDKSSFTICTYRRQKIEGTSNYEFVVYDTLTFSLIS